jgi:hypothetical protein
MGRSREPDDLPAPRAKVVKENCEGRHDELPLQNADAG